MAIKDLFAEGVKSGWKVHNGSRMEDGAQFEADVAIIGTGAGGGVTAEILSQAGLKVLLIEAGPLKSSNDFNMDESRAYSDLYQEGAGRMSKDGAITIMQGRCVGGTTVINWTSSFRTPPQTLQYWTDNFATEGTSEADMAPWFAQMEKRLNVQTWQIPANGNNDVLKRGCDKLGYDWKIIPRNVAGCWNLGYCGTGCPTNAKQSMLVTTIPGALQNNAELLYLARAEHFRFEGDAISELVCAGMDANSVHPTGHRFTVKAKHYVLSAGAIGSPGLLLRSNAPDPYKLTGKRTFLHPVPMVMAVMPEKIEGYYGAPQSIHSDHFQWRDGVSGPAGFKLEATPLQPGLAAALIKAHGQQMADSMADLPYTACTLALLRDGFHPDSPGGQVMLRNDGTPILDYPMTDYLWDGVRRALQTMAEIQFAAGARKVRPLHQDASYVDSLEKVTALINELPMKKYRTLIGSAHVMGGCPMGEDRYQTVVNSRGEHHYLENLSVIDGSVFPTSIGANPQLSIYGQAARMASLLAGRLTGNTSGIPVQQV
ncbi:GMC family oxidoreductase [Kistimonas asteriae]|uniref:GMC family oxidoreductase n=1 Tax=Kistimonas asteriae TaxID=517724 RepID=UPI001BA5CB45|nr:GMC family oxidoreductase [Kistimonas asteriae]